MRNAANGKSIYQDYELDAYLGDSADDYDRDAIIDEVTEIGNDGNRYWKDLEEDEFSAIVAKHDISEHMRGFYKVEDVPTDHRDEHGNWIEEDWNVTRPVLTVWIENGDSEIVALADADEPSDWDGTSPDEYERLEREACGKIGIDPESIEWDLK